MKSNLNFIDVRAVRRTSITMLGLALIAACDSDRAVSPVATAKAPSAVSAAVQLPKTGNMLIKAYTLDAQAPLVPGAAYKLIGPNLVTATIVDNGAGDNDSVPGVVSLLNIPIGNYYVCEITAPTGYAPADSPCAWWSVFSAATTTTGYFHRPLVSASWDVKDGFGSLIGPSTFTIGFQRGLSKITVVDNGQNDLDPTLGKMTVKLANAAIYTLCETVPPPNRYNANPACRTVDVTSGGAIQAGTFVNYEKQVIYTP